MFHFYKHYGLVVPVARCSELVNIIIILLTSSLTLSTGSIWYKHLRLPKSPNAPLVACVTNVHTAVQQTLL